ncbi:MAG: SDR family oxidoreductase [Hyphomicrobiaceae bacterium]
MQVVIITGAGGGIGRAMAEHQARAGWRVVCSDINEAANAATAARVGSEAILGDVCSERDVASLVKQTVDRHGRLDAIISNAGINQYKPLSEWTLAHWNQIIATNLTASFLLARAGEDALRASKGAMVLTSSTRAHMSEPGTFAYSASKGGLVALTHALAMSLQPDVRVNCVSPGWIDTGKHGPIEHADHAQHPVGRVGRPEDIAAAAAFLLDAAQSGFMTGQEMIVDGGMMRKMIYV